EEKVTRQQEITLHLIVKFNLIETGGFLLLLQYVINSLSGDQRDAFLKLTLPTTWGFLILVACFTLLSLLLFKNKWVIEKSTNRILRIVELAILLCFASFAAMHDLVIPAAIYG